MARIKLLIASLFVILTVITLLRLIDGSSRSDIHSSSSGTMAAPKLDDLYGLNAIENYDIRNGVLDLKFKNDDAYFSVPFLRKVNRELLRLSIGAHKNVSGITVYYGIDGQPYSEQRKWTMPISRLGNDILEIPLADGAFQSLRIDINGNSVNGEVTIGGLEVVPVSPPAIADEPALDASKILESTGEIAELLVNPGERFWIKNIGDSILYNPRFVDPEGVDSTSYNSLLSSLYVQLPEEKRNRRELVLSFWRYLSEGTVHHCSPGRDNVLIADTLDLVSGYGYGCCSHTNRALARIADHLGYPTRFVSTSYHEYPEIKLEEGWQIVDANRKKRWVGSTPTGALTGLPLDASTGLPLGRELPSMLTRFAFTSYPEYPEIKLEEEWQIVDKNRKKPLVDSTPTGALTGLPIDRELPSMLNSKKSFYYTSSGELKESTGEKFLKQLRDHTTRLKYFTRYSVRDVNRWRHMILYPGDELIYETANPEFPLMHTWSGWNRMPPHVGIVRLTTTIRGSRKRVVLDDNGYLRAVTLVAPYPILAISLRRAASSEGSIRKVALNGEEVGELADDAWVINREDLSGTKINRKAELIIDGDVRELKAELLMQYNPKIFNIRVFENNGRIDYSKTKVLSYKDDSDVCQRKVELGAGSRKQVIRRGSSSCLISETDFPSQHDYRRSALGQTVRYIQGCKIAKDGLITEGERGNCQVLFKLRKSKSSIARVKTEDADNFNWFIWKGGSWKRVTPVRMGKYDWLEFDLSGQDSRHIFLKIDQVRNSDDTGILLSKGFSYEQGPPSMRPAFLR